MRKPCEEAAILLFLVIQAADGALTYVGVSSHPEGTLLEGNLLLAAGMDFFGILPALLCAKLAAAGLGIWIYCSGFYRPLYWLFGFYLLAAILPWTRILFLS